MKHIFNKLSSPLFLGISTAIFAIISAGFMTWMLYGKTVDLLTENLRQRLLAIVTTQAANIDPKNVNALQVENDWKKPEWKALVTRLKHSKERNRDIVFVYIFRKSKDDPTKLEFVADAESINPYANTDSDPKNDIDANGDGIVEPDGADLLQWPGQEYPEPPEEAFLAFNEPLTSNELYEDAWGKVLTGYEPIYDEKGNAIAVLAVDIRANDFFKITSQTLYPFVFFIGFLGLVILVLSGLLIQIWNNRVKFLQELDKQKDELLSIVSHQLATPISSVKWYLEMLYDGDLGKLSAEQKAHLKKIQDITTNLSDLVSMILDVSRVQLDRMKVNSAEMKLGEFFEEICSVIQPKANEKKIKLTCNIPKNNPIISADRRLLRMTLENLLSNAIKYTPEKGRVEFNTVIKNNILQCSIKDNGCGIPDKEQQKIFGKLFRASNVVNTQKGNGFGLYVAKGAIEAQGGKIWFESKQNKGTTFYVELPLSLRRKS